MKILGRVEILGRVVIQVDQFPMSGFFSLKAPVGTIVYSDFELCFEKMGKDDEEWERSTFRPTVQNTLSWWPLVTELTREERDFLLECVMEGIKCYKQGEESDEGSEAIDFLNDCKFVGFTNQVQYVMASERGKGSLEYIWEHPYSIPSLLFKHKKFPFLIVANGNIDYDDGRMRKSKYNNKEEELKGISG